MNPLQMTRQYIEEHQIVERYLGDQLADAEREAFESYYLAHPEVLQELQAAAGLELGLQRLQARGQLQSRPAVGWRYGLAMAAALLLMVYGTSVWRGHPEEAARVAAVQLQQLVDRHGTPLEVAATYDIERTRNRFDAVVALPRLPQAIQLRVRPEVTPVAAAYQVTFIALDATGARRVVARLAGLRPTADEFIELFVSSKHLNPGTYELELRRNDAPYSGPPAQSMLIDVVAETAASR